MERTTPEAIDLQRDFRAMLEAGDRACAMEVSSHALELRRADAIHFAAAIFTNLTQDHLDFHPTMEDYFQAKRRLFVDCSPGIAVINVDDPYGARLAAELERPVTFALDADADLPGAATSRRASRARASRSPRPTASIELTSPLRGRFNVYNVLGAVRRGARARASTARPSPRRSRPPGRCRAASSPSTRARTSRSSSTTRTRPTRWRTCCGPRAT